MTNPAYEATNSDVEKPFSEEHERPSKILFIIAARIARREHLRPLYALSELNQKTIGTRALNQIIEQVEESLLRESGKLVRVAEKYEEVKRQNAELARRIEELESAPNGMMQLSNELAEMKRKCAEQASTKKYNVGEATMRHIFTPTGLTNVHDMQAVFDRVETVLGGMERKCSAFESGEYGFFAYCPQHGEEIFKKREDAIEFCNEAIEDYRQVNAEEGCDEKEVRRVCWGVIMQAGTDVAIDDDGHIDYALNPVLGTVEVIEMAKKTTMENDHE